MEIKDDDGTQLGLSRFTKEGSGKNEEHPEMKNKIK
jgi:hypothetical protein